MQIPENIPPGKAAYNVILKPRVADIIQPYKKGVYTQPTPGGSGSKRPRMESVSETGDCPSDMTVFTTQNRKYITNRPFLHDILKYLPEYMDKGFITAALAESTWKRILSAL